MQTIKLLALLLLAASATAAFPSTTLGDRLLRTFLVFSKQPLTETAAQKDGWSVFNEYGEDCVPGFGYVYAQSNKGPSNSSPIMLLYTAGGQINGFGVRSTDIPDYFPAIMGQFWRPVPSNATGAYDLFITFRSSDMACSGRVDSDNVIGDRLMINANFSIPLYRDDAVAMGFVEGNCIGKMGSHYWYDVVAPGSMSWDAATTLPVLPMYLNDGPMKGHVHAVLIATTYAQRIEPFGMFEGPFTNSLYCKNACKKDQGACSNFKNVGGFWTTMHWLFSDPGLATCNNATCIF